MTRRQYTIEVWDSDLERVGQIIPKYQSGVFRPVFNNVGDWQLSLPVRHPLAAALQTPGFGIVATDENGQQVMFGPMTIPTLDRGTTNPAGLVTIAGVSMEVLFADAICYPVPSEPDVTQQVDAYDVRSGNAETVMREYINANIGPGAPAARRENLAQHLVMGTNLGLGGTARYSARWDTLGQVLYDIATVNRLGFRLVKDGTDIRFEVYEIADKRAEIRLDVQTGRLVSEQVQKVPPGRTHVVVAGQGVGEERKFLERTTAASLLASSEWGRRIEKYKDQRQTNDDVELAQAGDKDLTEDGFTATNVKAIPADHLSMVFMKDWHLGDQVTVVVDGVETDNTATQAVIAFGPKGVGTAVGIGDVAKFSEQASAARAQSQIATRLSALERTVESSAQWRTYTPTVSNVTLGTGGFVTGRYQFINGQVLFEVRIVLGTGGAVTGNMYASLPVPIKVGLGYLLPLGRALLIGTSTKFWNLRNSVSTPDVAVVVDDSNTSTSATNPWTWAAGHSAVLFGQYEPA